MHGHIGVLGDAPKKRRDPPTRDASSRVATLSHYSLRVATWEDVRRIASALPGTEESTSYRHPAFRVRGKLFASMSPHEPGALMTRIAREEAPLLIAALPDVYFSTPHYDGYNAVLTRLEAIDEAELAGRLEDAWEYVSRKGRRV